MLRPDQLPDNLLTHRSSWLACMDKLVELTQDDEDAAYYVHEYHAMVQMYDDLFGSIKNVD